MKRWKEFFHEFFFKPAMAHPLACLRIGVAATLLIQAVLVAPVFFELYGRTGILQGSIADYLAPRLPHVTNVTNLLRSIGFNESQALLLLGVTYFISLLGLLVGWRTRFMAAAAWFTHFVFAQGHSTSYGADTFSNIFLFYLIWIPSGEAISLDSRSKPILAKDTTRLALRLVQLHLAISYFATGMEKALGLQWWNGKAIWGSLMLPVYRQALPVEWLASVSWVAVMAGWGTLLVEVGYPFFIFWPKTRRVWIGLIVSLHLGIAVFLGLHIFALIMVVLTVSLFGVSAETRS